MNTSFFGELLQTISERGRKLIDRAIGAVTQRHDRRA